MLIHFNHDWCYTRHHSNAFNTNQGQSTEIWNIYQYKFLLDFLMLETWIWVIDYMHLYWKICNELMFKCIKYIVLSFIPSIHNKAQKHTYFITKKKSLYLNVYFKDGIRKDVFWRIRRSYPWDAISVKRYFYDS